MLEIVDAKLIDFRSRLNLDKEKNRLNTDLLEKKKKLKYIPTKAGDQASGFDFQKSQARPKAASGQACSPDSSKFFGLRLPELEL